MGIVADQPDRELVARLEQQLAAHEEAVAVVDAFGAAGRVGDVIEAVALDIDRVEPAGERAR